MTPTPEEELSEEERSKEFYLDSLIDLEEEYEAGDLDEKDYKKLKSSYTKKASRALSRIDKSKTDKTKTDKPKSDIPFYKKGVVWLLVFLLVLGGAIGTVLALTSGQRSSNEEATGDVRPSTRSLLDQAKTALLSALRSQNPSPADFEPAITLFNRVLSDNPANLEALQEKSLAQLAALKPDESRQTLNEALELDPKNIKTLAYLANLEFRQRRYITALEYVATIYAQNPTDEVLQANDILRIELNSHFGRLLQKYPDLTLENYPESIGENLTVPTKFSELNLPNANKAAILAFQLLREDDMASHAVSALIFDLLVQELDDLFTIKAEKLNILLGHAIQFSATPSVFPAGTPNNDKGFASIDKAIALDPDNVRIYNLRGEIYERLELYEKAILDFEKAIELDPTEPAYRLQKARVVAVMGDVEGALVLATETIEIFPNYYRAYANRAIFYNELKRFDEALQDSDKAIELLNSAIIGLQRLTQRSSEQDSQLQTLITTRTSVTTFKDRVVASQTSESSSDDSSSDN